MAAFKTHYALRLAIAPEFFYCCSYMCLFYVCALGCWNKVCICMYVWIICKRTRATRCLSQFYKLYVKLIGRIRRPLQVFVIGLTDVGSVYSAFASWVEHIAMIAVPWQISQGRYSNITHDTVQDKWKVSKFSKQQMYSSSQGCHTATGTHIPHGITQCYLPPGRGDIAALTPAEAGTRLSDPGWCKAELT